MHPPVKVGAFFYAFMKNNWGKICVCQKLFVPLHRKLKERARVKL